MHKFWIKIGDKLRNFVALYRSPTSQTQDKFQKLPDNLELDLGTFPTPHPPPKKIPF